MSEDLDRNFARVVKLAEAAGLPEVAIGTSYGTPALLVKDKSFVRMKDGDTLVVMCALEKRNCCWNSTRNSISRPITTKAGRRCWFGFR